MRAIPMRVLTAQPPESTRTGPEIPSCAGLGSIRLCNGLRSIRKDVLGSIRRRIQVISYS